MRPPLNVSRRPSTTTPDDGMTSGRVSAITPSALDGSGEVYTSSVGRFGTKSTPASVAIVPPPQRHPASRPTLRAVPGPS